MALQQVTLFENQRDEINWTLMASGSYSAKSAYMMQFEGTKAKPFKRIVWEPWAPPKCKFFAWLILQNKEWRADRLQRRGMANQPLCPLCGTTLETSLHLLAKWRLSIRIWKEMERLDMLWSASIGLARVWHSGAVVGGIRFNSWNTEEAPKNVDHHGFMDTIERKKCKDLPEYGANAHSSSCTLV